MDLRESGVVWATVKSRAWGAYSRDVLHERINKKELTFIKNEP